MLRALVHEAEADPRIRIVVIGCSVGREVADQYSDLDVALALADEAWPAGLEDIAALVGRLGDVTELLHHKIPELGDLRTDGVSSSTGTGFSWT